MDNHGRECLPRLAVLSRTLPFPGHAGQQRRVLNKLVALRKQFHITFITVSPADKMDEVRAQLLEFCDDAVVLPSRYARGVVTKLWHRAMSAPFSLQTGLKRSNYMIGRVEFPPERLEKVLSRQEFDLALFEYWHAADTTAVFQGAGIPTVLDMHDVLWRSYRRQLAAGSAPAWWQQRTIGLYREAEEAAWAKFDALITINAAEHEYVGEQLPNQRTFYAPMGIDMDEWPYSWQPASPARVAYYGGLGSPHNQRDALQCVEEIMPIVWKEHPETEFWIVGSNPPDFLRALPDKDSRVRVTGFLEDIQSTLNKMSAVLCPWTGRYGFRSRLIEVMALGVPVVTTPDAVHGMKLREGCGIFLRETSQEMAQSAMLLLSDSELLQAQSNHAREHVKDQYDFGCTYGRLANALARWLLEGQRK